MRAVAVREMVRPRGVLSRPIACAFEALVSMARTFAEKVSAAKAFLVMVSAVVIVAAMIWLPYEARAADPGRAEQLNADHTKTDLGPGDGVIVLGPGLGVSFDGRQSISYQEVVGSGAQVRSWALAGAEERGRRLRFGQEALPWISPEVFDQKFWQSQARPPNVGPGDDIVWYKFILRGGGGGGSFAFVSTDAYVAEHVLLKIVKDGVVTHVAVGGTGFAMAERSVQSRSIVLPFHLGDNETVTAYLGISSLYTRNLLYQIMEDGAWQRYEYRQTMFFCFYFGILFFVSMVILAVYLRVGDRLALAYSVFNLVMLLATFFGLGFIQMIIDKGQVFAAGRYEVSLIAFVLVSIGWFTAEFLELKRWAKPLWWYYIITSASSAVCGILALGGVFVAEIGAVNNFWIQFSGVVSLGAGVYALYFKKTRHAKSFLTGLGIYMIGGVTWSLEFTGKIPSTWQSFHTLFVAQIIQDLIFAYSIIHHLSLRMFDWISAREAAKYGERMGGLIDVIYENMNTQISLVNESAVMLSSSFAAPKTPQASESKDLSSPADGENTATRKLQVMRIIDAVRHQKELLDSIRDLKAIEDESLQVTVTKVTLNDLLEAIPATFERRLARKNLRLKIDLPDEGEIAVRAERRSLFHNVICGLIGNAIKFSDAGSEVRISVEQTDEHVRLHVIDRGVGIPPHMMDRVFGESIGGGMHGTMGEKGLGFGLAICRAYMALYGGDISVRSKTKGLDPKDYGTCFTLTFQRAA